MDSPRGWLPIGAAPPLVEPPSPALIDVRLFAQEGTFHLAWRSQESSLNRLPSATGDESHRSRDAALRQAEDLFGLLDADWTFRGDGEAPTSDDVASIRDQVLVARDIDLTLGVDGLIVSRPTLHRFEVHDGEPTYLWIVLGAPGDNYLVFYDSEDGSYGLATGSDARRLVYLGDYGSLWETIESL
jgi:hypothetical protein